MKTRLDADKVEIVNIEEVRKEYSSLPKELIDGIENRFCWDIDDEIVMAVRDLEFVLKYHNLFIYNKEDFEWEYIHAKECSVCGEFLLSDDEVYEDEVTELPLCDKHSIMNENTDNYRAITDEEITMRNHCSDCKFCMSVDFVPKDGIIQESLVCDYYLDDDMNPMSCLNVFSRCKSTDIG